MFNSIFDKLHLRKVRKKWRKLNSHNYSHLVNDTDFNIVSVGNFSYGHIYVFSAKSLNKLKIGHFCSIANGVKFILNSDHPTNYISTYPFKTKILNSGLDAISKGDIIVDDDVWIGENSLILSGVHIGQGAIVAAGAVVTKDVPPYAIVGGVPAKVIKFRFEENIINKLLKIDYSKLTDEIVRNNQELFYKEVSEDNVDNLLDWLDK